MGYIFPKPEVEKRRFFLKDQILNGCKLMPVHFLTKAYSIGVKKFKIVFREIVELQYFKRRHTLEIFSTDLKMIIFSKMNQFIE